MLHVGLAEMQVLFRVYRHFLQDSVVKGFMFVNDVKVLTTFLTTTQTKSQVLFYTVHGLDFRFHGGVGVRQQTASEKSDNYL